MQEWQVKEHLRYARLPRLIPNRLAILEAKGGGVVYMRGVVRRGGHSSMLGCLVAGQADQ